jgi:hypothetical protein
MCSRRHLEIVRLRYNTKQESKVQLHAQTTPSLQQQQPIQLAFGRPHFASPNLKQQFLACLPKPIKENKNKNKARKTRNKETIPFDSGQPVEYALNQSPQQP